MIAEMEHQAAQWVALEDRGLSTEERARLDEWLSQSTAHRVCYLQMSAMWERADKIGPKPIADLLPLRSTAARRSWAAHLIAAAMLVCVLGAGGYYYLTRPVSNTYITQVGEQRSVRMADGTLIQLNTDTSVSTSVSAMARTVTLERGEAYFEVVHDARRPFTVLVGERRVTDLGTKFSVRRDGDNVVVVVREGRIALDWPGHASATVIQAHADDVVTADPQHVQISSRQPRAIDDSLSWRQNMLVFDHEPLAEVAREFNRYNLKQVEVRGPAQNLLIGGHFRADNLAVFASLLHEGFGLKVEDDKDRIVVTQ